MEELLVFIKQRFEKFGYKFMEEDVAFVLNNVSAHLINEGLPEEQDADKLYAYIAMSMIDLFIVYVLIQSSFSGSEQATEILTRIAFGGDESNG